MIGQALTTMSRNRYIILTMTAGAAAAISAIFLVGAPPVPAAIGIGAAIAWLIWRAPTE